MKPPSFKALLCGFIPFAALCFSVPVWDRVRPTVFGIPFNFFWLISWILVTPFCMWAAYRFEMRAFLRPLENPVVGDNRAPNQGTHLEP
jgi:hypothetical protein